MAAHMVTLNRTDHAFCMYSAVTSRAEPLLSDFVKGVFAAGFSPVADRTWFQALKTTLTRTMSVHLKTVDDVLDVYSATFLLRKQFKLVLAVLGWLPESENAAHLHKAVDTIFYSRNWISHGSLRLGEAERAVNALKHILRTISPFRLESVLEAVRGVEEKYAPTPLADVTGVLAQVCAGLVARPSEIDALEWVKDQADEVTLSDVEYAYVVMRRGFAELFNAFRSVLHDCRITKPDEAHVLCCFDCKMMVLKCRDFPFDTEAQLSNSERASKDALTTHLGKEGCTACAETVAWCCHDVASLKNHLDKCTIGDSACGNGMGDLTIDLMALVKQRHNMAHGSADATGWVVLNRLGALKRVLDALATRTYLSDDRASHVGACAASVANEMDQLTSVLRDSVGGCVEERIEAVLEQLGSSFQPVVIKCPVVKATPLPTNIDAAQHALGGCLVCVWHGKIPQLSDGAARDTMLTQLRVLRVAVAKERKTYRLRSLTEIAAKIHELANKSKTDKARADLESMLQLVGVSTEMSDDELGETVLSWIDSLDVCVCHAPVRSAIVEPATCSCEKELLALVPKRERALFGRDRIQAACVALNDDELPTKFARLATFLQAMDCEVARDVFARSGKVIARVMAMRTTVPFGFLRREIAGVDAKYVGRHDKVKQLTDAFEAAAASDGRGPVQAFMVCGETGMGKTTTVVEALRQHHRNGRVLAEKGKWVLHMRVQGRMVHEALDELAAIAREQRAALGVAADVVDDGEYVESLVKFCRRDETVWVLVVDDVLACSVWNEICGKFAGVPGGVVVGTSLADESVWAEAAVDIVRLEPLTRDEAKVLAKRVGLDLEPDVWDEVAAFCDKTLQNLPLAVRLFFTQARNRCGVEIQSLMQDPVFVLEGGEEHLRGVLGTMRLALRGLDDNARGMMAVLAVIDVDRVPTFLLDGRVIDGLVMEPVDGVPLSKGLAADRAALVLRQEGLVRLMSDERGRVWYQTHALIREAVRVALGGDVVSNGGVVASRLIGARVKYDGERVPELVFGELADVLETVWRANWPEADVWVLSVGERLAHAHVMLDRVMGWADAGVARHDKDECSLVSFRNLRGRVHQSRGQYGEALAEYRAVLAVGEREDVLGPEHPSTLTTRHGIAGVLEAQGQYAEALAEYRAVLAVQEREDVLGPEHPSTLTTRHNIAVVLEAQGQYAEALAEYRAVLAVREREDVLGPEHPSTLTTRHGIAGVLEAQGQYAEALAEYRAVLAVQEREDVLGPEHPSTLTTRHNIAGVLEAQGQYAEALAE
ncbi:tetratricopeptide TPR_2 repeat protein [Thecamonas trahens ATCC 50062]|uniref:Tetratricopeptide TPR_2 repeat protein n=1 Tax=Thecamonas trahens ATCC 50062 TaxID=461836 RepID=A0A0L0D206_THETB|nr:tetratricopeptide TPR_2 repeat protein [Thecamonas trahens ATCC 50062]KNC46150.1 tetratricopeptide TPR_2 repeat protein [Thecamonas trahens ATCC 50062]|eukprot:XP_013763126.1 tetratricopeptide TPR_2 repeat protein [Thecamonas trahens ATCC 50062]